MERKWFWSIILLIILFGDTIAQSFLFDRIYVINLKRREERKREMIKNLEIFGGVIPIHFIEAVDGMHLTSEWLERNKIKPSPFWRNHYYGRILTRAEVAITLSHLKGIKLKKKKKKINFKFYILFH